MKSTKLVFYRLGFALLTLTSTTNTFCQVELSAGAESAGLGHMRFGLQNVWTSYNNPTDMVCDTMLQFGLSVSNPFNVPSLKSTQISTVFNRKTVALGVYYNHFGYRVSRQQSIALSVALKLNERSVIGLTVMHHTSRYGDIPIYKVVSTTLALKQQLTNNTDLHFMVINPFAPKENQTVNSQFVGGIALKISDEAEWMIQSSVSPTTEASLSTGFMYRIRQGFRICIGINSYPRLIGFGFVFQKNGFRISTAYPHHQLLGFTPQVSAQWSN